MLLRSSSLTPLPDRLSSSSSSFSSPLPLRSTTHSSSSSSRSLSLSLSHSSSSSSPSPSSCWSSSPPSTSLFHNGALLDHLLLTQQPPLPSLENDPCNSYFSKPPAADLRLGGLDIVRHSYSEKFVIRCYEVGMNRTASIETIANLLQEVACNHAQSVGFSTDGFATTPSMRKRRLIWVTTQMHIEVDEYPVWGDVVEVETWCQSEGKVGTRRDWLLTNVATGKLIGRATSTWVMMNQDTRRLSRITEDVRDEYTRYCPTSPRYAFPEEDSCGLRKIPKLEDPAQYSRAGLMPRRGDLDMNQHVNNVTYIGWILESMPQHIIDTHQLHRITLDYRRECKRDDAVESLVSFESCGTVQSKEEFSLFETNGNGSAVNGSAVNGAVVNGSAVNGAAMNGAFSSKNASSDGLEFLHVLRLACSEIEINRGRTKWRKKADRPHNSL